MRQPCLLTGDSPEMLAGESKAKNLPQLGSSGSVKLHSGSRDFSKKKLQSSCLLSRTPYIDLHRKGFKPKCTNTLNKLQGQESFPSSSSSWLALVTKRSVYQPRNHLLCSQNYRLEEHTYNSLISKQVTMETPDYLCVLS